MFGTLTDAMTALGKGSTFLEPLNSAAVIWDPAAPRRTAGSRLEYVLELTGKLMQASLCGIGLLTPDGEPTGYVPGSSPDTRPPEASLGFTELIRLIIKRGKPVRFQDAARGLAELGLSAGPFPAGPFLGLPLAGRGRCEAILYLARPPGAAPFHPADVDQALALSGLLEQEHLAEEVRLLNQVRLLTQVAQAVAGKLELKPIFAVALRELERHLPMNACAVWLASDDEAGSLTLARTTEAEEERTSSVGLPPGLKLALTQTSFETCWRDGQALYVDLREPVGRRSELAQRLAAHGATYFFAAPLRAGDQTVGVLQSICKRPSGFTGEQIQLLFRVADLLGPAISNCELFGRLRSAYEQLHLTQKQLVQAEKMRAIGELASGMAHDFNNSLCGVVGFLELALLEERLPGNSRNHLDNARTCALDAAQTVRRVQEFARHKREELANEDVDLRDLVWHTIELTRPKWEAASEARSRPIKVEFPAGQPAWTRGNPAELREALTNIIFNAVDAMPQGGTLGFSVWDDAGKVRVAVRDSGIGMNEPVRRRLFEPFFTTKGEQGNGLGLSVTFGIVQRHAGEISVDSAEGMGSTFTICLPASEPRGGPSAKKPVHGGVASARSLRILVVEDEESIRSFLDEGLKHLGHRPRPAATAAEGLAAFANETFDLVFTDLGLPDFSGEELARLVTEKFPNMPVVMITGWADQLSADNRCPRGVQEVIGKPITLERIAQTLARISGVLGGRKV